MADTWHVVAQHQTTELTPVGNFQEVMEVSAQSDITGTTVTARIPMSAYTPANVAAALEARFETVHLVHEL